MSFIYSQALVGEYLAANCSDINAFAQSNGSPTPKLCLSHDKTMDASRLSRFGMTCRPLTESHGAELLTWWLEDFHVRTYQSQEKARELTEPEAECGDTWRGWLAKFDPNSSSWKTAQLSLIGDSGESLATFPRSGMTRGGLLWELPMLERPTNETGSGFWPTPVASDTGDRKKPCAQGGTPLSLAVKLWPTPRASDHKGATSSEAAKKAADRGYNPNLPEAVAADQNGGRLNPTWVEWLMGWPLEHTALKPSETAKFQPVPQPHGEILEGLEA